MVVEWLLDMIEGVMRWMIGLLPYQDVDPFAAWGLVMDNLSALNYYLPIYELFVLVLHVFYVIPYFLGFTVAQWIWKMIRG